MWSKNMPWAEFDPCGDMLPSTKTNLTAAQIEELFDKGHLDDVTEGDTYVRPFDAEPMELRLVDVDVSGRIFWWEDTTTHNKYPMRSTEFNQLLSKGMKSTTVKGLWSAHKRGYATGIVLVSNDRKQFEEAIAIRQP